MSDTKSCADYDEVIIPDEVKVHHSKQSSIDSGSIYSNDAITNNNIDNELIKVVPIFTTTEYPPPTYSISTKHKKTNTFGFENIRNGINKCNYILLAIVALLLIWFAISCVLLMKYGPSIDYFKEHSQLLTMTTDRQEQANRDNHDKIMMGILSPEILLLSEPSNLSSEQEHNLTSTELAAFDELQPTSDDDRSQSMVQIDRQHLDKTPESSESSIEYEPECNPCDKTSSSSSSSSSSASNDRSSISTESDEEYPHLFLPEIALSSYGHQQQQQHPISVDYGHRSYIVPQLPVDTFIVDFNDREKV